MCISKNIPYMGFDFGSPLFIILNKHHTEKSYTKGFILDTSQIHNWLPVAARIKCQFFTPPMDQTAFKQI